MSTNIGCLGLLFARVGRRRSEVVMSLLFTYFGLFIAIHTLQNFNGDENRAPVRMGFGDNLEIHFRTSQRRHTL